MHAEPWSPPDVAAPPRGPYPATRAAVIAGVLSFVTGGALGLSLGAKFGRPAEARRTPPTAAAEASVRRVRMSQLLQVRAGVTTAAARRRPLSPTLDAVGSVEFDRDRVAEVGSRVEGRVSRMLVGAGAAVQAGQPLVEIESAAVSEALGAYVTAQAAVTAARAESARLARLEADRLVTAREVEQQRAVLVAQEATQRGAFQRLMAAGLSAAEVQALARAPGVARVTLRAPIAGRVVAREVVLGEVVEPTTTILEIADPTRLWVQLEVFERDLAGVAPGSPVEIKTDAHPDVVLHGTVAHVATSVNHATRTARVRVEIDNAAGALRPGQFVRARVRGEGAASREAVTVPRDAIVQVEGRPAVFVAAGDAFELRVIEPGAMDGDEVEVVRGVDAGEAVVIRGAFALKSELLR
jgi:cobalt-zinc-cadmium efflux system membrane fusion protein